jgi:hypothetical protein
MGRVRRELALEDAPLSVHRVPDLDSPDVEDVGEPEEYGLRVTWQSEAVRIEAAEFLVATRIQQAARIRAAHDLEQLRHPGVSFLRRRLG